MQQSNGYIIIFAIGLAVVLGGALAFTSEQLKPIQKQEVILETKKQIMSALIDTEGKTKQDLAEIYDNRIKAIAVNTKGQEVNLADYNIASPENINVQKQYKALNKGKTEEVLLPVYSFMSEDGSSIEATVVPVYGYGLWDNIWGFVAVGPDMNTVRGVTYDHKAETPGLGARITDYVVQQRYIGKKLFDGSTPVGVIMVKGEGNSGLGEHEVDGMSGATITGNGVNEMLLRYAQLYQPYFNKAGTSNGMALLD